MHYKLFHFSVQHEPLDCCGGVVEPISNYCIEEGTVETGGYLYITPGVARYLFCAFVASAWIATYKLIANVRFDKGTLT
jgi:hypothetical protein